MIKRMGAPDGDRISGAADKTWPASNDASRTLTAETSISPVRPPIKIFQIGFNKCGTTTIHHYLRANGVRSVHWDFGRLAKRMFANLANGDDLLSGYEDFDAFTDMEYLDGSGTLLEGYKLFPYLAEQYPDAVFILNTRDREDWVRSRLRHGSKSLYAQRFMAHRDLSTIDELTDHWRTEWDRHHSRVIEYFKNKPLRFFVCRIETDLPHLLNQMLPELSLDVAHYRLKKAKSSSRGLVGRLSISIAHRAGYLRDSR